MAEGCPCESVVNAHGYVYSWTINGETRLSASPGEGANGASIANDDTDWGTSLGLT